MRARRMAHTRAWGVDGGSHRRMTLTGRMDHTDQEKKKRRPQQERARARRVCALLQLLAVCAQGQGHQALHREEHGGECRRP